MKRTEIIFLKRVRLLFFYYYCYYFKFESVFERLFGD